MFQVRYHQLDGRRRHLLGLRDFTDQHSLSRSPGEGIDDPSASRSSLASLAFDKTFSLQSQNPLDPESRLGMLEVDIIYNTICAASPLLTSLVGKQLDEVFPAHVADEFHQLWGAILAFDERSELATKVMAFEDVGMSLNSDTATSVSGTVEVTKSETGDLEFFLCFNMPQVLVGTPRRSPRRSRSSPRSRRSQRSTASHGQDQDVCTAF